MKRLSPNDGLEVLRAFLVAGKVRDDVYNLTYTTHPLIRELWGVTPGTPQAAAASLVERPQDWRPSSLDDVRDTVQAISILTQAGDLKAASELAVELVAAWVDKGPRGKIVSGWLEGWRQVCRIIAHALRWSNPKEAERYWWAFTSMFPPDSRPYLKKLAEFEIARANTEWDKCQEIAASMRDEDRRIGKENAAVKNRDESQVSPILQALDEAVEAKQFGAVEELLHRPEATSIPKKKLSTILVKAAESGRQTLVQLLIERGASSYPTDSALT